MDKINDDEADMLPKFHYRDKEKEGKIIAETLQKRALKLKEMEDGKNMKIELEKQQPKVLTHLVDKHHSPMIIRKYTKWGFPLYVGIISDDDLSDFDEVIVSFMEGAKSQWKKNNIQILRNVAGDLTEHLTEHYGATEGVAVIFYWDKTFKSIWNTGSNVLKDIVD